MKLSAGRRTLALIVALVATSLGSTTVALAASPQPYGTNDFGGFRNILPPGENGLVNANDATQFEANGTLPPHSNDQTAMYENLVYATPGLTAAQLPNYYKDATYGAQAANIERTYSPTPGCTVTRDQFGIPHIYGTTRSDVVFCTGYVGAEDRLFFMDVLRHAGRGQLSGFAGGSNKAMDADVWGIAPYTEADLQKQIDSAQAVYGQEGAKLQQDLSSYVAGVNQYISDARTDPSKMPSEYAAIQQPLNNWVGTDVMATASLIGGIFGKGGGNEIGNALALQAAIDKYGGTAGERAWRDFRRMEDPEAPTTVQAGYGNFTYPRSRGSAGVAMPDRGSLVNPPNSGASVARSASANPLLAGLSSLGGMSNALLISAAKSQSGHPVAVMGPQVAYFMPEILMEEDLHGPGFDARGATFPGVNMYVELGHGNDYAWSATSAGQDIIDTFAEKLCEPDGSQPTVQSTHYLYKGECLAMDILTRTNNIVPNPADPSPPETFTLTAQRTVHGIVYKRGTVDGQPVAFTRERSTYFHEADSALGFSDFNDPTKIQNVQDFQQAANKIGFTFNWFYADDRDIGYFNSGWNPIRASGADPDFPNWGTGQYDWQGFNKDLQLADFTPFGEHAQVINQPFITSWNNKQAAGTNAADDNYAYGPVFRSQSLDKEIQQRIPGTNKLDLPGLVDSMEQAGKTDLRGTQALPYMLQVIGSPSDPAQASAVAKLTAWMNAGAHRADQDQDNHYEYEQAIQIMDAWWPRAVTAMFKPEMGQGFFDAIHNMQTFDDSPNSGSGSHVGSAYIDGWYGYVNKDLRQLLGQSVQDSFSRPYCGSGTLAACRTALLNSLSDALSVPASQLYDEDSSTSGTQRVADCPASKSDQWCWDSIRFRPIGVTHIPTMHWINRPTFQQAVEVQGHRARGYPRPRGATPFVVPLVPAYRACASPNRTHGPPLAFNSCSAPVLRSDYLTFGTPDANGKAANSVGSVTLRVQVGNPSTPANEADVLVNASLTDVRKQTDLSDYTGELKVNSAVRLTDANNGGASGSDPATVSDFPLGVTMPCAATTSTLIGGACSVATSLDALVPGTITESKRSVWALGEITVSDGGSDGLASTSPNTVLSRQGVFVP
jgi:acyl-homoserine lactone acylase PvdQ